jgi:hypothetical protein
MMATALGAGIPLDATVVRGSLAPPRRRARPLELVATGPDGTAAAGTSPPPPPASHPAHGRHHSGARNSRSSREVPPP